MAQLIYKISTKTLTWTSKNEKWSAVSGPHGLGSLPTGSYDILRRKATAYSSKIKRSFQDETGKGFFIPIIPKFDTTRGKEGDGRFGIHPDGGVSGTLGCIGITKEAASFYEAFASTPLNIKLVVKVID